MIFRDEGSDESSAEAPRRAPRRLTDPKAMRAVAHPTRLALIEALGLRGTLTATEAAAIVGESPTNCAFHLRTLAKYGFVEEAGGGAGRRRPWQLRHIGFVFDEAAAGSGEGDGDGADDAEGAADGADGPDRPESRHASDALSALLWETWLRRLDGIATRRAGFPAEWRALTGASETVMYLTPDEAEAFQAEMLTLLTRYHDRLENAALRPAGSVPVELIQFTFPYDATRADATRADATRADATRVDVPRATEQ
ncbi:winged helix-turn-helix domain-containing protein [Streptacidiphilus sp. EB129]|uniref:winged helix-turn-helix domain-containing protein n=1 Tax=Streptacidiphilus sp. EB129 TaxID=3156262 RepID=UPI0035171F77